MVNIIINRSDSRCEGCGLGADMYETGHYTLRGYGEKNGQPGCGAEYDGVTSDYMHLPEMMAESDQGYFFAENLRGLPVYTFFDDNSIGVYGGTTRKNATLRKVSEEDDDTIYEAEDLR